MQIMREGQLEEYKFSVIKAFAEYANVPEKIAQDTIQNMALTDYASFVSAIDTENDKEIERIVNKYIETEDDVVLSEGEYTIAKLNKSKIFENVSVMEEASHAMKLPKNMADAYRDVNYLSEEQLKDYVGFWLVNENAGYKKIRDVAIMKHVFENTINPQLRNNIARISNKSSSDVKNPTYVDDKTNKQSEIVDADPQKNVIATKDEDGEVNMVQMDPNNKKQIALEELKKLAGI